MSNQATRLEIYPIRAFVDDILFGIIKTWLYELEARQYSVHTIRNYLIDLISFCTFLVKHKAESIEDCEKNRISFDILVNVHIVDLRAWLAHRLSSGASHRSNGRATSAVRAFYRYIEREHSISHSAVFALKLRKKKQRLPCALTFEQVLAVLKGLSQSTNIPWVQSRNIAIALMLYCCGLRISEALAVSLKDIQNAQGFIVVNGKGGKKRAVPLLPIVCDAIQRYTEQCPYVNRNIVDDVLFYGEKGKKLSPDVYRKIIRVTRELLNIPVHVSPHTFRHSFATALLNAGVSTRSIQELLGHTSISSTEIYTHVSHSKLLETHRKFHPSCNTTSTTKT